MYTNNKQIIIVIPTYNAKGGILRVISGILKNFKDAKIIVVDDNSPDGTAKLVNRKFASNKGVKVIVRSKKLGRGSAVIKGLKDALGDSRNELFIEMDADLIHSPNDIPRLIEMAKKYDVVVASRYLVKSQIIKWAFKRRIISRLANLWIKFMLGISLTDNTSGFRCYKRNVLEGIDFNLVKSKGFIVLTEISNQIYKKGFTFGEIPIDFIPIDINRSNLNIAELREAFFTVFRLKLSSFRV